MLSHIIFPEYLYEKYLHTINSIKFTSREIDIMSCVISGKNPQSISNFLSTPFRSIELQTVNTHIVNIRRKIDGNSRESIIHFIEKSDKHKILNQYYSLLLLQRNVQQIMSDKILPLLSNTEAKLPNLHLIFYKNKDTNNSKLLASALHQSLVILGIKSRLSEHSHDDGNINSPNKYKIYILPTTNDSQNISYNNHNLLLLADSNTDDNTNNVINIQKLACYYSIIFAILRHIFPALQKAIDEISANLDTISHPISLPSNLKSPLPIEGAKNSTFLKKMFNSERKFTQFQIITILFCSIFLSSAVLIYNRLENNTEQDSIHSDLNLPVGQYFLERENIIKEISAKLKNSNNIQILAITGPGGSGKTTIAHHYASKQRVNVVWVINASTQDTLRDSFEQLAEITTEQGIGKKQLSNIKEISDPKERTENILNLIKKELKKKTNWLLIYDNVENISALSKYLPRDNAIWGNGQVIITTRDSHAEDNQYIHHTIALGELNEDQKLNLFQKILKNKNLDLAETKQFLTLIPPFPLDISIAAYYLKSSNTPYSEYLSHLENNSMDFEHIQSTLLKEAGEYDKTRYNIITTSLQRVTETHPEFLDLLLFISLIGSNDIPRELLYTYKSHIVVDSFIYNLKKYSLIHNNDTSSNFPLVSWHKSTQSISLDYLIKQLSLKNTPDLTEKVAKAIRKYTAELIQDEDSFKVTTLLNHCEQLLSHKDLLNNDTKARTQIELGSIYYSLGYNFKAKTILEETLPLLQNSHDSLNTIKYAKGLTYLALTQRRNGEYKKAIELLIQSIPIYQRYPSKYRYLADNYAYLGNLYKPMGEYSKAKILMEKSLKIYQDHNDYSSGYAKTLLYLGNIHRLLGNYKKATELCEIALEIYRKHPENYSGIARNLEYLGMLYNEMGLHDKAIGFLQESRKNYEAHYRNTDNIQCDTSLMLQGISYNELGEYKKAKALLENMTTSYIDHYGNDHPEAAFGRFHLARATARCGDLKTAEDLLQNSLIIHKQHFGNKHPKVANILQFWGQIKLQYGDIEKAEELALDSRAIFLSYNHPAEYKSLELLGDIYAKKAIEDPSNRIEYTNKATEYFLEALKITKVNFPTESSYTKRLEEKIRKYTNNDQPHL